MKNKKMLSMLLSTAMVFGSISFPVAAAPSDSAEVVVDDEATAKAAVQEDTGEREVDFNKDWKFALNDQAGADQKEYDDSEWDEVMLPHDFSITQEFSNSNEAESGFLPGGIGWYRKTVTFPASYAGKNVVLNFDGVYNYADVYVNGTKVGENRYGYTSFAFDISDLIICDGNTENVISVKAENKLPSSRWYSGSGIYRDVTLEVTENVHVALDGTYVTTPDLETQKDSDVTVQVVTTVENDTNASKNAQVRTTVVDTDGDPASAPVTASVTVAAGAEAEVTQTPTVNQPDLWDCEDPNLYYVKTEVLVGSQVTDTYMTEFGFRYIEYDAATGFLLNGEHVKMKGVCMHHDQGALGSAAYDDAIRRQVRILKEMGCNAIRTSHNTYSENFYKICNEQGILVMDEVFDGWTYAKNGNRNDFSVYFAQTLGTDNQVIGAEASDTWAKFAIKSTFKRDRNNPSVVMWSIGNEIDTGCSGVTGYEAIAANLIDWMQDYDTTRPITMGDNDAAISGNGMKANIDRQLAEAGGVVGLNYHIGSYAANMRHALAQGWPLVATETASPSNSRGIYSTLKAYSSAGDYQCTAYDTNCVGWGNVASDAWYNTIINDQIAGEFIWTGFDYIGEPTPWNGTGTGSTSGDAKAIPNSSFFGVIDTAGFPKDSFYYYTSQWREDTTTLHVVPQSWNQDELVVAGGTVPVDIYSNAAKVELYLNDTLIGTSTRMEHTTGAGFKYGTYSSVANDATKCSVVATSGHKTMVARFNVTYEPGTLSTKAYDAEGHEITDTLGLSSVTTNSDEGTYLQVTAEETEIQADGSSLSYISVDVMDGEERFVSGADNNIRFNLTGNGTIVGVDNGNPSTVDKFQQKSVLTSQQTANINAFSGKALVIVRSTEAEGGFTLRAASQGLEGDQVTVDTVNGKTTGKYLKDYDLQTNYSVEMGTVPELPTEVSVTMSDGASVNGTVVWDEIGEEIYNTPGDYTINGVLTAEGGIVSVEVYLHVSAKIVAMQNYSRATSTGVVPKLPDTVSGILPDGRLYDGGYQVTWEAIAAEQLDTIGTILKVNGTAEVAEGKTLPVIATVRVAEGITAESVNVAPTCASLTENCNPTSDNLQSIKDGAQSNGMSDPNNRWTNWDSHLLNSSPAIFFTWDETQMLNHVDMYYFVDASVGMPEKTEFAVAADGVNYNPVTATASETTTINDNCRKITYQFASVQNAQAMRITLTQVGSGYVGLSECEIYTSGSSYTVNNTAVLDTLTIDGAEVEGFVSGEYNSDGYNGNTTSLEPVVEAAAFDNAAVTVIPMDEDNVLRVMVQSEDKSITNIYTIGMGINLGDAVSAPVMSATRPVAGEVPALPVLTQTEEDVHQTEVGDEIAPAATFDKDGIQVSFSEKWAYGGRLTAANDGTNNEKFDFYGTTPYVIRFSMKIDTLPAAGVTQNIIGKMDGQYGVQVDSNRIIYYMNDSSNGWPEVTYTFSPATFAGKWHDIMAVYTGTTIQLYVDGESGVASADRPNIDEAYVVVPVQRHDSVFTIGKNITKEDNTFYTGLLADTAIYIGTDFTEELTSSYAVLKNKLDAATPIFAIDQMPYSQKTTWYNGEEALAADAAFAADTSYRMETVFTADSGYIFTADSAPQGITVDEKTLKPQVTIAPNGKTMTVAYTFVPVEQQHCTCAIDSVDFKGGNITMEAAEDTKTAALSAEAVVSSTCNVEGHEGHDVTYTYVIGDTNTAGASIENDQLTVTQAGTVKVQVTAVLNGDVDEANIENAEAVKTATATFTVTSERATAEDKAPLNATIALYKDYTADDYTEATWTKFSEARDNANAVAENPKASKTEVSAADAALKAAAEELKTKAEELQEAKDALSALCTRMEALDAELYTTASYGDLKAAVDAAKVLLEGTPTLEEINAATTAINEAEAALEFNRTTVTAPVMSAVVPEKGNYVTVPEFTQSAEDVHISEVADEVAPAATLTQDAVNISFDGKWAYTGRLTAPNAGANNGKFDFYGTTPYIIRFSMKVDTLPATGTTQNLIGKMDNQYGVQVESNRIIYYMNDATAWPEVTYNFDAAAFAGKWHDIMAVFTGTKMQLYVDGQAGAATAGRPNAEADYVVVPQQSTGSVFTTGHNIAKDNTAYYTGLLSDVAIYTGTDYTNGLTNGYEVVKNSLNAAEPKFAVNFTPYTSVTTWSEGENELGADAQFETGKVYTMKTVFNAEDGYKFDETSKPASIALSDGTTVVPDVTVSADKLTMTVSYTFPAIPEPTCSCEITSLTFNNGTIAMAATDTTKTATLNAVAVTNTECKVDGHSAAVSYTYAVENPGTTGAMISGKVLTVTGPGTVTVKVTAVFNEATEEKTADFTVTSDKATAEDKAPLNTTISSVSQLKEADYTEGTWSKLQTALEAANTVAGKENASKAEVTKANTDLAAAISGLKTKSSAEKENLSELFEEVGEIEENLYTAESYNAMVSAHNAAVEVYNNPNATLEQITAAKEALQKAKDGLKTVAEAEIEEVKTNLEKERLEVEALIAKGQGNYTDATWKVLKDALEAVQSADANADKAALVELLTKLSEAKAALKENAPQTIELAAPSIKTVKSTVSKKASVVKVTVNKVANADSYTVYRKIGSAVITVGTTTSGTITDKKPVSGKRASYYAVASSKNTQYTKSKAGAAKGITLAKATKKVTAKKSGSAVRVSWTKVKNAKGYYVYRSSKKSSGYVRVGKVASKKNYYIDKKAKAGKKYYYKIVTKGKSAFSNLSKASKVIKVKK